MFHTSYATSGVPQCTVLDTILFLILIDSIGESDISAVLRFFADDTRITKYISSEGDMEKFQEHLEKLFDWQESNNMVFNGDKFENLKYGTNEDLKNSCNFLTPNSDGIFERKECLRDLGIQMNEKADFSDHINSVCSKVNQKSGWILRTFMRRHSIFMKFM